MSVIRFDANVAIEVSLKYDSGKQVQSRIPEAPDQMMYTVCGDDTIYLPLSVAAQITQLGIRKMELIAICKRQQHGVTRWEVKRLSDAAQPTTTAAQPEPPSKLEAGSGTRRLDPVRQGKQSVPGRAAGSSAAAGACNTRHGAEYPDFRHPKHTQFYPADCSHCHQ